MTSDTPVVNGSAAVAPAPATVEILPKLSTDEFTAKFVNTIATAVANNFSKSLVEQVEYARAEEAQKQIDDEEAAKAEKARLEQPAKPETKEKEKKRKYAAEDQITELNKIDSIFDSHSNRQFVPWSDRRGKIDDDEKVDDGHAKWVLVLRRVFNHNMCVRKIKLDVKSPLLKKIIKEVCNEGAMETEKASLEWPSEELFRWRDHIREAAEKGGDLAVKHTAVLLDLIGTQFPGKIRDIKDYFPRGVSSFEVLREAFWPGDIILSNSNGLRRAYRVKDAYYQQVNCVMMLLVQAESINYDGSRYGTQTEKFGIEEFNSVKYFEELPVFPMKYCSTKDKIREKLIARGRKFASLAGQHYKTHAGVANNLYCRKANVNSRVMIDTATFNRLKPDSAINVHSIKDKLVNGELTEEQLMLCTDRIPIFSFQDKEFYITSIDKVSDIVFNEDVFGKLVLPNDHKELVRVLVETHTSNKAKFDDFVEGKGQGLVAVLHGPPGVGKTMTAEAVAEYTKRPLYIVTSGELGSNPSQMESQLEEVLDLAKTWRAVLLLDEADVFLEQRTTHDLVRNSLVSIFLRLLEYYQGIMFLTTNRVATFDEAFHSRIHISLHYHPLTQDARMQVWRNFAQTMAENVDLSEEDFEELSRHEVNGRVIKNLFRTSQALASDKGEKISIKHMRIVLGVMSSFDIAHAHRQANGQPSHQAAMEKN
ncbi:P-loop containing nucleoside triphosphate hydrolase protein [Geopyxis carbonaria]|nr:P-loop containing nucleoside triphosphate hydrolase protein [Geopyxis carbonaria]